MFGHGPPVDEHGVPVVDPPKTAGPELTTFAEKQNKEAASEREQEKENKTEESSHLDKDHGPLSAGATLVRKFGSMLVGRADETRRHHNQGSAKRGIIPSVMVASPRPSHAHEGEVQEKQDKEKELPGTGAQSVTHSPSQPVNSHRRAATVVDPQGRTARHERRSSTGAAFLPGVGGTIGRHRRPSTGYSGTGRPLTERLFSRTEDKNAMSEKQEEVTNGDQTVSGDEEGLDERHGHEKDFKPVFLKGLFRSVHQVILAGYTS
jgi:hypothetical protein